VVIAIDDGTLVLYRDIMEKIYLFRDAFNVDLRISRGRGWWDGCGTDPSDGPGCIHLACMSGAAIAAYAQFAPTTRPCRIIDRDRPALRGAGLYAWRWCRPVSARRDDLVGIADWAAAEIVTAAADLAWARGLDGLIVRQHPSFVGTLMAGGWDVELPGLPTLRHGHPVVAACARTTPETAAATRRFFGREPASPRYLLPLPVSSPDTEIRLRA
jgi:N-acyl-L-homoserine lactone synthetase